MTSSRENTTLFFDKENIIQLLAEINVPEILRDMFRMMAKGEAVQPPQQLVVFPENRGDFINYLGVLATENAYAIKTSPYIVQKEKALVTAWTLLMSMETGKPLLLTDANILTVERTAGTTALAVDCLAPVSATRLAVIGAGALSLAHIRYVRSLRSWGSIKLYSLDVATLSADRKAQFEACDSRISFQTDLKETVKDADVILLCTSSGTPVIDPGMLNHPALITSISTNVAQAHEVPPQSLMNMDVYCDYKVTTPYSAGEMVLAAKDYGWSADLVKGDLPALVTGQVQRPDYQQHAFFRSIGLGLEDAAIAHAIWKKAKNS